MERGQIPNSLKRFRRIAGLSQVQVATILGFENTCSVCRWERGYYLPGVEHLFQLSILYNISPETLYSDFFQSLKQKTVSSDELLIGNKFQL
jgi:transcriptional regulator with XRE-family HTH domain